MASCDPLEGITMRLRINQLHSTTVICAQPKSMNGNTHRRLVQFTGTASRFSAKMLIIVLEKFATVALFIALNSPFFKPMLVNKFLNFANITFHEIIAFALFVVSHPKSPRILGGETLSR